MTTRRNHGPLEAADRMSNTANVQNTADIQEQLARGALDPSYNLTVPDAEVLRVAGNQFQGTTPLGTGANTTKTYSVTTNLPRFVPDWQTNGTSGLHATGGSISGSTPLTNNITIGTFMGGVNRRHDIEHVPADLRGEMLKYLYVHAELLKAARSRKEFQLHRIVVEEGIYNYEAVETGTEGDLAALRAQGRAIAYTVKGFQDGAPTPSMNFRLAEYWMHYPFYDKLILDYHTYAAGLGTQCRVYVTLPELDGNFEGTWSRQTETRFNGVVQSNALLLLNVQSDGFYI